MKRRLGAEDIAEIGQVASLLLYLVDSKQLDRLSEVFTQDGIYDGRATRTGKMAEGVVAIRELWANLRMGVHYSTDMLVLDSDIAGESATSVSRWIHTADNKVINTTGVYRDQWTKTPEGWRIRHRVNTMILPGELTPEI